MATLLNINLLIRGGIILIISITKVLASKETAGV